MNEAPTLPSVPVDSTIDRPPVRTISPQHLQALGSEMVAAFNRYRSDRHKIEQRWLRDLRQFLGRYDPDIESRIPAERSKAYPRITRVKTLAIQSRLMNLMFPGNEKNWELTATPSADLPVEEVQRVILDMMQQDIQAGVQPQPPSRDMIRRAVQRLAAERARELEIEIEDQLQEIGGDQTRDYISMVRDVVRSGATYGVGLMEGPFARPATITTWDMSPDGRPVVRQQQTFKPVFEPLQVWDFYPDMTARSLTEMDGYFTRRVMSRGQVKALGDREDFLADRVKHVLRTLPEGNYRAQAYETELRDLGPAALIGPTHSGAARYEVIVWRGLISGQKLHDCGAEVAPADRAGDIDAEIWMIDDIIIKVDINAWRKLGRSVRQIHAFVFSEDDSSPLGIGIPSVMRDSQLAVCAAARMALDNASVTAGPNLEVNMDLLTPTADPPTVQPYRIWYREGNDPQFPAVRVVNMNSHLPELLQILELFMRFADAETFIGPASGGEPRGASEPMRTAAGASMLRADASLPFKDIVRSFDSFTQSQLQALVEFNLEFNPRVRPGDYNIVARGATSLIAKEVRGIQLDQMAATLSPQDRLHVDERKFLAARFSVRDLDDMLVAEDEVARRRQAGEMRAQEQMDQQKRMVEAQIRKVMAEALKDISQSQKNATNADMQQVKMMLDLIAQSMGSSDAAPQA